MFLNFQSILWQKNQLMKKILSIMAIAMIGLFVFAGCSKKSSSPSYTMKATVGSTAFSANNCIGNINSTLLSVYGYNASGTTATFPNITIQMSNYTAIGTFTIDTTAIFSSLTFQYYPTSALTDVKSSKTGTLTLTSVTSTAIAGTFSFTCTDGTTVTGGTFSAKRY